MMPDIGVNRYVDYTVLKIFDGVPSSENRVEYLPKDCEFLGVVGVEVEYAGVGVSVMHHCNLNQPAIQYEFAIRPFGSDFQDRREYTFIGCLVVYNTPVSVFVRHVPRKVG